VLNCELLSSDTFHTKLTAWRNCSVGHREREEEGEQRCSVEIVAIIFWITGLLIITHSWYQWPESKEVEALTVLNIVIKKAKEKKRMQRNSVSNYGNPTGILLHFSPSLDAHTERSISWLICFSIQCRQQSWQLLPMQAITHHMFALGNQCRPNQLGHVSVCALCHQHQPGLLKLHEGQQL